ILAAHRARAAEDDRDLEWLRDQAAGAPAPRGFRQALARTEGLAVIAEIKRRSPSKGDLHAGLDPATVARAYADGGATCLSVLTAVRGAVELPILRKDFTVSELDVCDTRLMGADAVLLIAAALGDAELAAFHQLAGELGLDALVEVHDEAELERALGVGADLI